MITPQQLENQIMTNIRQRSGFAQRQYLGMSHIGKCAEVLRRQMVNGLDMSDHAYRMAYTGMMHEWDTLDRLREMGVAVLDRRELMCPLDNRLRGHIDSLTAWGDVLEIKSVSAHKFETVCYHKRPLFEHSDQVQLYMRYGGWRYAWFVYVNRESFEHRVFREMYNPVRAASLEEKALHVLQALDENQPVRCECGKCQQQL